MIEKSYYRMQELEKALGFSSFDYKYLIENFNIPLHTFIYCRYFILSERQQRSFKKIIKGVAYYSGTIELPPHTRKHLLRDEIASLSLAYLDDISHINTMESCSKELLKELFGDNFEVKHAPSFNELNLSQCDAFLIGEENRELVHTKDTPIPKGLDIKFNDLVLKRELVEWCKLQLGLDTATNQSREHLMKEQIRLVSRDNPHLGATKLYKLMRENFENDIDATDPLSILISIDRNEIIWGKPGVREHTMSLKTFQNTVSEIKKSK
tara:strand:+ start:621 stop:1421 length:801 start_codon:yes stop_codon:yes gene_type:complete